MGLFGNKKELEELQKRYTLLEQELNNSKDMIRGIQYENNKLKQQLKEEINKTTEDLAKRRAYLESEIKNYENKINDKKNRLNNDIKELNNKKENIENNIEVLKRTEIDRKEVVKVLTIRRDELNKEILSYNEELTSYEHGLYKPKYVFKDSNGYKNKLTEIRKKQKEYINKKTATSYQNWVVNGDANEGEKMTNDMIKLCLRAFNTECDNIILTVKYGNYENSVEKINKLYESINKLGKHTKVEITTQYLYSKLDELELAYLYAEKKQEEKEEQARIKQLMREEQEEKKKIEQEIKREIDKLNKEESHFNKELSQLNRKLKDSKQDKEKLLKEIEQLKEKLKENEDKKQDVLNIKERTRAGYVYVISNIGSFGENVYKIGMTRRLNPEDRISELGNASVPFKFDIHAMIFSEDAPKLENDIHKLLNEKRVNKVNKRKEFFNVTLDEIEDIVINKLGKSIEFTKLAEAKEYYQSI